MALIESVIEKTFGDGTKYWVAVIDGKEVPCYDSTIKDYKGKENPFQIALSAKGKEYLKVPKQGGNFKGSGGWKGKSELEIKAQVLTMSMAYSKDVIVAYFEKLPDTNSVFDLVVEGYRKMSQAILADLTKITPEAKPDINPPNKTDGAPQKPPQKTSPEKPKYVPPADSASLTVKQKLEKKMWAYLQNMKADDEQHFKQLLVELTEFKGKDGKMIFVDNMEKLSEKWAGTATGKLEKLIDEEERKAIAEDSNNPY